MSVEKALRLHKKERNAIGEIEGLHASVRLVKAIICGWHVFVDVGKGSDCRSFLLWENASKYFDDLVRKFSLKEYKVEDRMQNNYYAKRLKA